MIQGNINIFRSSIIVVIITIISVFITACSAPKITAPENISDLPQTNNQNSTISQPFYVSLRMINDTTGWALDSGKILRTTDGGKIWNNTIPSEYTIPTDKSELENIGFCFLDANSAWIALTSYSTNSIKILYTTDGGTNWATSPLPVSGEEVGGTFVDFVDGKNGWVMVMSTPAAGLMQKSIYHTKDGGKSWVRLNNITNQIQSYPSGMKFLTTSTGWITCIYHGQTGVLFYKTTDGGKTWGLQDLPIPFELSNGYYANPSPPAFMGNEGIAPIEFTKGQDHSIILYITRNGGKTWTYAKGVPNSKVAGYSFINSDYGWAINNEGKTFFTINGGKSWTQISINDELKNIHSLCFVTKKIGFTLGDNAIYKTIDGGENWLKI